MHPFVRVAVLEEAPFVIGDPRRVGFDVCAIAFPSGDRLCSARVEVVNTRGVAIGDLLLKCSADRRIVCLTLTRTTIIVG